ncbi:MAG: c-type cytochrome [Litorivicinaceae bacterium]
MNRVLVFFSACAMATLGWAAVSSQDAVLERLKSPAAVCVQGDPCADAVGQSGPTVAAARTGEQVYGGACAACHNSGAAGAPKLGDAAAWADRLPKGTDTLVSHVINGYNAMPAKGLCMDCSDAELADAVAYMIQGL